jgi:hypothetical protein
MSCDFAAFCYYYYILISNDWTREIISRKVNARAQVSVCVFCAS